MTDPSDEAAPAPAVGAGDRLQDGRAPARPAKRRPKPDAEHWPGDGLAQDRMDDSDDDLPTPSAADRVQKRDPAPPRRPIRVSKLLALSLLGGALAVAAVLWFGSDGEDTDLLGHLVDAAEAFRPDMVTIEATVAEQFVMDAFGWPVRVPDLPGLQLVGVGEATIVSTPTLDVSLPAFRYDAPEGDGAVVFVYDYVLLDGAQGVLTLPEPMYARLAEDPPIDVRRQGGTTVVTWRARSVLYAAVTDDEALAESIAQSIR